MIPAGWKTVRLGDVIADAQPGFASGERSPNGVPQLRMNNVTDHGAFDWSSVLRVPADPETVTAYSLRRGDVLFNNTNSTALVGKSALFAEYEENIVYSNHFTRIRTDSSRLLPEFLALWLQFQWQQHVFENICNRWIGQSAVQRDKLLALEIALPSIDEQRRIAAEIRAKFARIDQARAAAAAQLEAAKALPAAYLRGVFDSPAARAWPLKALGEICRDISDGTHFTPNYVATGIPFLSVKDINENRISFDDCRFISSEQHAEFCRRCKPEIGDVLYTKVGTTGVAKAVDVDREFSIFVSVALLKLKPDVLPTYLETALNSPSCKKQAADLTQGMANRNLVLQDLKRILVPIPVIECQQKLTTESTAYMEKLAALRSTVTETFEGIARLPVSLLRQAFQGEI